MAKQPNPQMNEALFYTNICSAFNSFNIWIAQLKIAENKSYDVSLVDFYITKNAHDSLVNSIYKLWDKSSKNMNLVRFIEKNSKDDEMKNMLAAWSKLLEEYEDVVSSVSAMRNGISAHLSKKSNSVDILKSLTNNLIPSRIKEFLGKIVEFVESTSWYPKDYPMIMTTEKDALARLS